MERIFRVSKVIFALLIGLCCLLFLFVHFSGNKTFDATLPEVQASTDSLVIERGKYLVFGPAHCASCHAAPGSLSAMDNAVLKPLTGGLEITIPPATIRAMNLTPDSETGIGKLSDGQIARALRYGIGYDGRMLMPVMEYSQMSDEDLTAIISFLRSQKPVKNEVKKSEFNFLGKALLAFGVLQPRKLDPMPASKAPTGDPLIYGEYLAKAVANCQGCHTQLDVFSGKFTVPPFAGGFVFEPDALTEGFTYVSPNLTMDQETGMMAQWTDKTFVQRFQSGRVHLTSPMPWGAFSRMDTADLKAIYLYLQSLEPVRNPIEKTAYLPGETVE